MKNKSKKLLSALLASLMMLSVVALSPLTSSASTASLRFQITEHPAGATYNLNDTAIPLRATFEYAAEPSGFYGIDTNYPITVAWYRSSSNSTADRSNRISEGSIPFAAQIRHTTTHVPATSAVGVMYYYAVVTYMPQTSYAITAIGTAEVVTNTARVEVIISEKGEDFPVFKVDENGNPLAGAVIQLVPDRSSPQNPLLETVERTTGSDGYAWFNALYGDYILSEKQAPAGFNATDEKYNISITANGIYISVPTHLQPYSMVTFVNKKIPELNRDDHFAFMQGYPAGTFLPGKDMTRAEAVVMFSRLLSEKMNLSLDYRNNFYPDIKPEIWYANQVGYMQGLGVLADYSRDGKFRPEDPVTRAEFATLATHFANLVIIETNAFTDVPSNHWAVKYINSAAAMGWIEGYADNTFRPEANITRAEVVTIVGRVLNRFANSDYLAANLSLMPRIYSDLSTGHWAYCAIMEASTGHDYYRDGLGYEHWTSTYE